MTKTWPKALLVCTALVAAIASSDVRGADEEKKDAGSPPAPKLRQILLSDSIEGAQALSLVPDGGFVVLPPTLSFLSAKELEQRLAAGRGRDVDERLLVGIAQVIENAVRQKDFPIATAVIPVQRISDGAVRVAVLLGKFREIKFQGNRWFSDSLLREKLDVRQGEVIRLSELDRAMSWTNNSPFRRVRLHIDPIPNTGEANLVVGVQERLPLRLIASFDDGGNEVIGTKRMVAGLVYGNVMGRDHELSYQFITTDKPKIYQGHGLNYRVPLPWRHHVQISGSYAEAKPEFFEGLLIQKGINATAELRYTVPLRSGLNPIEAFAALAFKQSNNNLEFGGTAVLGSKTDIFQVTTGVSAVQRDKLGVWVLGASLTGSPGGLNARNQDAVFNEARLGARAAYLTGTLSAQRLLKLSHGWELNSRALYQMTSSNLLPTEQLAIGGAATARGFDENTYTGDKGVVFSNDLLAPEWNTPVKFLPKGRPPLSSRLLLFFDAATAEPRYPSVLDRKYVPLASVGMGLRTSLPNNFSLTADYGWQITSLPSERDGRSRAHIKVMVAY